MKKLLLFLIIGSLITSCYPFNRMTSPEVLPQEERTLGIALQFYPLKSEHYGGPKQIFAYNPVIYRRSGLSRGKELGLYLYLGPIPTFSVDLKHQIVSRDRFKISGDVAIFVGGQMGLQYDLLFGNSCIYGVSGINWRTDLYYYPYNSLSYNLGIGTEFGKQDQYGLQLTYTSAITYTSPVFGNFNYLSIGLKYDFRGTKRKYRQ